MKLIYYSLHISPIENIFHLLKDRIYDGEQFKTKDSLWLKIEKVEEKFNRKKTDEMKKLHQQLSERGLRIINKNENELKINDLNKSI